LPQLAANLSLLFTDRPFLERFGAAAQAGFRAVEFQFPYDWPLEALQLELQTHRLKAVLHNLPAGDWAAGDRGLACDPDRVDAFRDGVQQGLRYALGLDVPQLNCLAGVPPPGVSAAEAQATLLANLRFAATALAPHGLTLLIEPINTMDVPGFFVNRTEQAVALVKTVGAPNLKVQYDVYHAQRMEGELAATLQCHWPHIGHVQIADNPGRHEPGTGEINYRFLFDCLDRWGYEGHVGCEYRPALDGPGGTEAGLSWVQGHGLQIGGMA
jgi:hydroxypyruvate isomerase